MSGWKKWLFRALALGLAIALCEAVLFLAAMLSPRVEHFLSPPWRRTAYRYLPDDVLVIQPSPHAWSDLDSRCFRNPAALDRCDVLCVGDSQTFGLGVAGSDTWPRQLEALSGKISYNMSCPGYGPCQHRVLIERGLSLNPSTVAIGLYVGNDFIDAYLAASEGAFPELLTTDLAVRSACQSTDQVDTFEHQAGTLGGAVPDPSPAAHPVRLWLSEHSSLYALARESYRAVAGKQVETFEAASQGPRRVPFDADARVRTVFKPEYRTLGMNLEDARVREGKRIAEAMFRDIQSKLQARGIRLIIVVIPTKELVYHDLVKRSAAPVPPAYWDTIRAEERLTAELEAFLRDRQIEYVNVTAALRSCLDQGVAPFPETDDGHPNASGCKAIALGVAAALAQAKP